MVRPTQTGMGQPRSRNFKIPVAERIKSKFVRKNKDGSTQDVYQIHIMLEDLEGDWKPQHEWYGESNTEPSAYWDFVKQLMRLNIISATDADDAESLEVLSKQVCEAITDKKFHFEERRMGNKREEAWFPVNVIEEAKPLPTIIKKK